MNFLKRMKNLYALSGIEVGDVGSKAATVDKLAEIFRTSEVKNPQKLASIISLTTPDDDTATE